jgi:ferredoxin-fold anticodon binding domain-containing protein
MSNQFVFNQYYIDFIKRLKQAAKKLKEDEDEANYDFAKKTMKNIKENYITLDKSSDEYVIYINAIPEDFWSSYVEYAEDDINKWFESDDVKNVELYKNITVADIRKLIVDDYLCHHFITVFYLFKNELDEECVKNYVKLFQGAFDQELFDAIENETHKNLIKRLNELKNKNIKDRTGINMAGMEDTMLGKLAKEILEDVDVDKLQKSIGDNGDILKAIGDPDSGFSELITNVSRKMATKISNGELKQENLLQDAMKFAATMPGLFGGGGGGGGAGAGNGGGAAGAGAGAGKQPDMSSMMNMMSAMMNNKEGMDAIKKMMDPSGKQAKGTRTTYNKNAYRKSMAANKLKSKLAKRREEGDE